MSNQSDSNTNPLSKFFIGFMVIAFLILGVYQIISGITTLSKGEDITLTISHIDKRSKTTGTGTNKRIKIEHIVYVNYTYKGQEYTNVKYNVYTKKMKKGGTIKAKINPSNPREFYYSTSNIKTGITMIIVSGIFGFILYTMVQDKKK